MKSGISIVPINSPDEYFSAITRALDDVSAVSALAGFSRIIIKPNMVNYSPPQAVSYTHLTLPTTPYV